MEAAYGEHQTLPAQEGKLNNVQKTVRKRQTVSSRQTESLARMTIVQRGSFALANYTDPFKLATSLDEYEAIKGA